MTKKKASPPTMAKSVSEQTELDEQTVDEATSPAETLPTESNAALIEQAIDEAKALMAGGSTKIAAAMIMYEKLEKLSQETVVDAFIKGTGLTSKGALTYWYNCRRKTKKMRTLAPKS